MKLTTLHSGTLDAVIKRGESILSSRAGIVRDPDNREVKTLLPATWFLANPWPG